MAAMPSTIDQLNSCLRGEISAAETYRKALEKLDAADHAAEVRRLEEIQRDHGLAAQELRARIQSLGGDAANDSGAWGAWANTVQATANIFGDTTALKALKEGEEHGLKLYERVSNEVDPQSQQLIGRFATAQQQHIRELDSLMHTV